MSTLLIQPRRLKYKISPFSILSNIIGKTLLSDNIIFFIIIGLSLAVMFNGCHKEGIAHWSHTHPAWSPDNRYIAFVCYLKQEVVIPEDTSSFIKILDLETDDIWNLTSGGDPDWAPDGGKIVFDYYYEGITIIDVATKQKTSLTHGGSPDWSPDGSKILFAEGNLLDSSKIFMLDIAQGNTKLLIIGGEDPKWHPSGEKFIYNSDSGIYMADTNGNVIGPVILKSDSIYPMWAEFANNGNLVYTDIHNRILDIENPLLMFKNCYLHILDTLGNDFKLTEGCFPSWSPDGKKIVFARYSDEEEATALWIMDADGSNQRRITDPE